VWDQSSHCWLCARLPRNLSSFLSLDHDLAEFLAPSGINSLENEPVIAL
jgi:hypothetical protein